MKYLLVAFVVFLVVGFVASPVTACDPQPPAGDDDGGCGGNCGDCGSRGDGDNCPPPDDGGCGDCGGCGGK